VCPTSGGILSSACCLLPQTQQYNVSKDKCVISEKIFRATKNARSRNNKIAKTGRAKKAFSRGMNEEDCGLNDRVWSEGNHECTKECINADINEYDELENRCLLRAEFEEEIDQISKYEDQLDEICPEG